MGYEICFKYNEKLEDGSYDKSESKELRKKVGEPFEDVPLEKLVQVILAQFARRDIWVTPDGVEIFEYKKQKISFKETKGGILIKNKKFMLDNESNMVITPCCESVESEPEKPQTSNALVAQTSVTQNELVTTQPIQKRPIKFVVLDDGIIEDHHRNRIPVSTAIKNYGLQFKLNKKYPVFAEIDDPRDKRVDRFGQPTLDRKKIYIMQDDLQREVSASTDYFVSANVQLQGGALFNDTQPIANSMKENRLQYEGEVNEDMPSVR